MPSLKNSREEAFDQLVLELSPPLHRYLRRLAGDPVVADDLLQETLIRIARGLGSFTGRATLKTWAFSIATHAASDYFRKPGQKHRIDELSDADDVPDTGRRVDHRMVVDEMNACVRQVIDRLPEDYRAALVLHDLEGMSVGRTAHICECSIATAKIRIHRARNRLRQALQQQCEFYRDPESVLRCDRKSCDG
jgi:RNA polymerase sigma-70 factor, ECF subfamily